MGKECNTESRCLEFFIIEMYYNILLDLIFQWKFFNPLVSAYSCAYVLQYTLLLHTLLSMLIYMHR